MTVPDWFRQVEDGVELEVKVTPRAGRSTLDGTVCDAAGRHRLAVRLKEAPADGAANAALLRLLAESLGVPRSTCRLVAGEAARIKRVRIAGDPARLAERLRRAAGELGA